MTTPMSVRALITCWLLALSAHCPAEVIPTADNDWLGAQIRGLQFPDKLQQDLISGLTNRILVRMTVLADGQTAAQAGVAIGIKYDLWEETFRMTMSLDGRDLPPRTFAKTADVVAFLGNLATGRVFRTAELQRTRTYTLQAEVLFDPVDRERMDKIRQWVAQTSNYPSAGVSAGGSGGSPSAVLFNRIFEQYAAGADIASVWRQSLISQPFRLEDLQPGAATR